MEFEKDFTAKIAWYYYIQKKTQKEIATLLNISRMKVIRQLERAEQENLVQVHIKKEFSDRLESEYKFIQKFNLKDAVIIPSNPSGTDTLTDELAKAAAMYVKDHFSQNNVINIGYGNTVGKILNYLSQVSDRRLTYVSLTGGVSIYLLNNQSWIGNANLYLIPAPLISSTKELVDAIQKETTVMEISKMHKMAGGTIIGIGTTTDEATMLKTGIVRKETFELLKVKGAVGDIIAYFFDENGNIVENELNDHLISYPLNDLSKLDNVVAVAGGQLKRKAIKAALKGNYMDILITDEDTANWLMENA